MVTFAHVADTHLGYRQYNLDDREQDFYESFRELIDKIIEQDVDFVIHAGDLFEHSRPKVEALLVAYEGFKKLQENDIPIYAIPGNHDVRLRQGFIPPHRLLVDLGVKILGQQVKSIHLKEHDLFLGGIAYLPRYYSDALKKNIQNLSKKADDYKKRILILHQGLQEHLPWEGAYELTLADIPKNFQYYAFGHVHRRIEETFGKGMLSYPGSTDIWRTDEIKNFKAKKKGFNLVDFSKKEPEIELISLETTRHFDQYTLQVEDFQDALENMQEKVQTLKEASPKKPIIDVIIQGEFEYENAFYSAKINQALGEAVYDIKYHFKPKIEGVEIGAERITNLKTILDELYDDPQISDFAHLLHTHLKVKDVDAAIAVAQEYYEQRWEA